jgi:hypothetical protein
MTWKKTVPIILFLSAVAAEHGHTTEPINGWDGFRFPMKDNYRFGSVLAKGPKLKPAWLRGLIALILAITQN